MHLLRSGFLSCDSSLHRVMAGRNLFLQINAVPIVGVARHAVQIHGGQIHTVQIHGGQIHTVQIHGGAVGQ